MTDDAPNDNHPSRPLWYWIGRILSLGLWSPPIGSRTEQTSSAREIDCGDEEARKDTPVRPLLPYIPFISASAEMKERRRLDREFDSMWDGTNPSPNAPSFLCRRGMHDYDDPPGQPWLHPTRMSQLMGGLSTQRQFRKCKRDGCGMTHHRYRDMVPNGHGFTPTEWRDEPELLKRGRGFL